ncbi:MAG: Maf family protein, partial [Candidatus Helarchaeota archaeon]
YISTNEPYDAAGAYKIQGLASIFIEKIDGCYFNVMGFPIFKFYTLLNNLNIDIWKLMVKSDQNENRNSPI